MSVKRTALHAWQRHKTAYDAEQEYIAAERLGRQIDDRPFSRTLKVEHLEGTELRPSGKALIRLKGKWLGAVFRPGTRVAVEVGEGILIIKRAN